MITTINEQRITSQLNAMAKPMTDFSQKTDYDTDNFAYFKLRALSKDLLKGMIYYDLTKDNILEESVSKLIGKTVYANHNKDVKDWVGKVIHAEWNSTTNPQGIDAIIRVPRPSSEYSTDFNSHVVKGLLSGSLNSFSVGVLWSARPSHPDMHPKEFLLNQGNNINNEVVRLIIEGISNYQELSVVFEGHDPNAKLKDEIVLEKNAFGLTDSVHIDNKNRINSVFSQLSKGMDLSNIFKLNHGGNMNNKNEQSSGENTQTQTQESVSNNVSSNMASNNQRLDNLEKKILSLSDNVNQLTDENEELRANEIFYKEKLQQIESEKAQLQKQLLNDSYESFKEENLREGNLVKSQLLVDSNGKEHLKEFYQSLSTDQQKLFTEFVKNSPLRTLTNLSQSEHTTAKKSKKREESVATSNKESFMAKKIREYAKLEDKTMMDIYQDDSVYNRLYSRAEHDWHEYLESN